MSIDYELISFAKINLSLLVYKARRDGYHPICSVFQAISLYDKFQIKFISSKKLQIHTDNLNLPLDKSNLIYKAYEIFKNKISFGLDVFIEKNIPIGAGLGGGSSNAGVFLAFLNAISKVPFSQQQLLKKAKNIGADVPFFLTTSPALVRGIGEKITPLSQKKYKYFLLIYPNIHISTPALYKAFDLSEKANIKAPRTPQKILKNHLGANDFMDVVFTLYPQMKLIYNTLSKISNTIIYMSGSGSTFFIPFTRKNQSKKLELKIKQIYPDFFIKSVKFLNKGYQIKKNNLR